MAKIIKIIGREILDSRGNPTVEAEVILDDGSKGRASVPSGASTGSYEAVEKRDNDPKRFLGKGVLNAVNIINNLFNTYFFGFESNKQELFDQRLIDLDGTKNKSNFGANAILAVSLAYAWASANSRNLELFEYIGEISANTTYSLPRPMMNIMNGGKHADWATDIQEYMIIPINISSWRENLRRCAEVYHHLGKILKSHGYSTNVGNEGGYAPIFESNENAIQTIINAVELAGYKPEIDFAIGLDAAASEFFDAEKGMYVLKRDGVEKTSDEMIEWFNYLYEKYPIISVEDWFCEDDIESWRIFNQKYGNNLQIVGDDLLVTNTERIKMAIENSLCNTLLVKMNQIGTLSETIEAIKMAKNAGWKNVVSHRSGETEDVTLVHLAVGTNCGQIKSGAPSRTDRVAKYNELIRIEEIINQKYQN